MGKEITFAVRRLLRAPGFTAVALVTLALGIGANTAIFSVVDAVLLRPLPYPAPDRLVMVWQDYSRAGGPATEWFSPGNFYDWREQSSTLAGMAAFSDYSPTLVADGEAERLGGAVVTHGFFRVLGVEPVLGRVFTAEEDTPGNDDVALLSYGFWQSRFGGQPEVVGRTVSLSGRPTTIIGVLPQAFEFPLLGPVDVWQPLGIDLANATRGSVFLRVVGRLAPGATLDEALADLGTVAARLEEAYPAANQGVGAHVTALHEQLVGNMRLGLVALLGAVGLVLLIACVNLANLLLVRSAARRRDRAIRTALGAGPGRLAADTLLESLLISVVGGALGLIVAAWLIDVLVSLAPIPLPGAFMPVLDGGVLVFAMALAVVTGIVVGVVPALHGLRGQVVAALKEGGAGTGLGRGGLRARSSLVAGQVALAFALLVGAGLLLRSFSALQSVDPGFEPEGVLTFGVGVPASDYPEPAQVAGFYAGFLERVRSLPGAASAGMVSYVPMSGSDTDVSFVIEGEAPPEPGQGKAIWYRQVDPEYFRTMRIPVLAGRTFTAADDAGPPVAVLGEAAARRYFPGQSAVGERIKPGSDPASEGPWWTIIGVVGSVRHSGLDADPKMEMYIPHAVAPRRAMTIVVRTAADDPLALVPSFRAELGAMDPNLAISGTRTAEALIAGSVALPRFLTTSLVSFGVLALVLAGLGIYGVIAYTVSQRTREMGIRLALGAHRKDVVRLVMKQGSIFLGAGLAVGLGTALLLGQVIRGLLFQVPPQDAVTLVAVPILLAGVAFLATYIPARRATRVDPVVALREE